MAVGTVVTEVEAEEEMVLEAAMEITMTGVVTLTEGIQDMVVEGIHIVVVRLQGTRRINSIRRLTTPTNDHHLHILPSKDQDKDIHHHILLKINGSRIHHHNHMVARPRQIHTQTLVVADLLVEGDTTLVVVTLAIEGATDRATIQQDTPIQVDMSRPLQTAMPAGVATMAATTTVAGMARVLGTIVPGSNLTEEAMAETEVEAEEEDIDLFQNGLIL